MSKTLPERPDLEQLKKQAKELLDEIRAGRLAALTRLGGENGEDFALHDAQRVLAREFGFPSWAKLKLHVETRTEDAAEDRLIKAALEGDEASVDSILAERPSLGRRSVSAAAAPGDGAGVEMWLERDPSLARTKGGSRAWEPLLYLCYGRWRNDDATRAASAEAAGPRGGSEHALV